LLAVAVALDLEIPVLRGIKRMVLEAQVVIEQVQERFRLFWEQITR
jgi:adenine/guanine phosphoribosyltransferase-like PRPP-binding protein